MCVCYHKVILALLCVYLAFLRAACRWCLSLLLHERCLRIYKRGLFERYYVVLCGSIWEIYYQ